MTVTIPARNEEDNIVNALRALAQQADPTTFDVLIFANNCTDATAQRARAFARDCPRLRLEVIEAALRGDDAHVGAARKTVMDRAAQRFLAQGQPLGIVATTDADTIVAADWVAQTIDEMKSVDAVAGFVEVTQADQLQMIAPMRLLYAREMAFRRVWTELEALIDPRPEDPLPRHGAFVGASFAVTAEMYVAAGTMPAIPALEDRQFLNALRRVDAKIRFSLRVRAATSGRRAARVSGGFGTFLGHLHDRGSSGETFSVENPYKILDDLESRAALRRIWQGDWTKHDIARVCDVFGLHAAQCIALVDRAIPFGAAYERIVMLAGGRRRNYPMVSVDEALSVLRAAAALRNATAATLLSAASGAG